MKPLLSVFVPCYNEEQRLEKNILLIYHALLALKKPFELVIVDDGSTDATSALAKKLIEKHKEIVYQYYSNGPSRRENLGKAFYTAKNEIIVFMDLDLSADLAALPQLISSIGQGNDIAIGSRYKGVRAKREFGRKIISVVYNWFMRMYFGSVLSDHQCGFKAFRKERLLPILDLMDYDATFVRGWFWDVELLVRAQKLGYKIDEFSVAWSFGKQSSFNFRRELKMLPYVLKLKWRL